jgi:hexosaminidase
VGVGAGRRLGIKRAAEKGEISFMGGGVVSFGGRIIPKPVSARPSDGCFAISPETVAVADIRVRSVAESLVDQLAPAMGWRLRIASEKPEANFISLTIDSAFGEEGYRLKINPSRIDLAAKTRAGLFWAVQSLRQLFAPEMFSSKKIDGVSWEIPCGTIEDYPRFSWRGMMLDCSRHFMPIEFIYKWVDLLTIHKLNVFHWHLTDDQGWRIEIKKYPRLVEVGAWRKETLIGHARSKEKHTYDGQPHGGFYSQEQIKSVVKFAAERNITIVPEIELPGHSQAAIAAYPHLGNTGVEIEPWTSWGINANILNVEESTVEFYQDVLSEVMELFPSPYIHIGGDEAMKDQWKNSRRAQARMRELGLKDEEELQSWFVRRMDAFLTSQGRKLIGWDEILEGGLASGAVVMSWRGEEGGIAAARAGHDVVMAPQKRVYFDHYQSEKTEGELLAIGGFSPVEQVYQYEPIPAELDEKTSRHVLGAQGQLWTEYVPGPAHAEYMTFPRLCALSEVLWSAKEPRDFAEYLPRLKLHLRRLKFLGVNFRPLDA